MDDRDTNAEFVKIVMSQAIDPEFVREMLASMYNYLYEKTKIPFEEISFYLKKLEQLLGPDGVSNLELEEIVDWLITLHQHPLDTDLSD